MHKWLVNSIKYFVIGFFSLILIYLLLLSCFSTTAITSSEHPLLIADSAWRNLIVEGVFLLVLFIGTKAYKKLKADKLLSRFSHETIIRLLLLLLGVTALLFVFSSNKVPYADQVKICNAATEWSNGIYSSLDEGGYLQINPHQAGIVIILYLLGIVFGNNNYIVFQLINVVALVLFVNNVIFISNLKKESFFRDTCIVLFFLLFFPSVMYSTFVYGTLIGLSLAIASFRHLLCFENSKEVKHAVLSGVFLFLSIMFKQNYFIFGIAIICYIAYKLICKFNIHLLALAIIIALVIGINGSLMDFSVYQITNRHLAKGMSSLSYVYMGIKESDTLYNGWWDGDYSTLKAYRACNYDHDRHDEISLERINTRINELKNDPVYAIKFFSGKNASQWNNPDFQGWWINAKMEQDGNSVLPIWLERSMSIWEYNRTIFVFLDCLQFIILFGVIMYLIWGNKENDALILLMIVFIGGFLFHTIWEAKQQYTFVYFLLLLPISADGYAQALHKTENVNFSDKRMIIRNSVKGGVLALLLLIVGIGNIPFLNSIFIRNDDAEEYSRYLSYYSFDIISNGEYRIRPTLDTGLSLAARPNPESERDSALFFATREEDDKSRVIINMQATSLTVNFSQVNMCLDTPNGEGEEGKGIWAYRPNGTGSQKWTIKRSKDDDSYSILYGPQLALTYDLNDNRVYLSKYTGDDQQQWLIQKQDK